MSEATMGFDPKVLERRMAGALEALERDCAGLRTGRASPGLLDPVQVMAYGSSVPLTQVAGVSVPDPRMLSVTVWDASLVKAVEKAIRDANLGLNPVVEGTTLRLPVPELNEQRRQELIRLAGRYAEAARIAIRNVRRDGMDQVRKGEKDGAIGKDEARRAGERVQKMTDDSIGRVDVLLAAKERDILQV